MPTALIVEDEPAANGLLATLVQLRGYRTESAFTGGEALRKIEIHPPDVVFLDLMLPDIPGVQVCESLRAREAGARGPTVVVVSARVAAEGRLQSFAAGADDYIPKPYTPDQIFQALADDEARRRLVARPEAADEGVIPLDRDDVDESLRRLARLRGLLPDLSPFDGEQVARLGDFLRELWLDADAWGKAHGVGRVAELAYRLDAHGIALELRAADRWLADDPLHQAPGLREAAEAARFDRVERRDDAPAVILIKSGPDATPRDRRPS